MAFITKYNLYELEDSILAQIRPAIELMLDHKGYYICLSIVLVLLIIAFKRIRNKNKMKAKKMRKSEEPQDGFKNFNGDTWYPDGRVWVKDEKRWEESDYKKK